MEDNKKHIPEGNKIDRRSALKGLLTVPVVGAMAYGMYKKKHYETKFANSIKEVVDLSNPIPDLPPLNFDGKRMKLGVIGIGGRGGYIMRAAGFLHPQRIQDMIDEKKDNPKSTRYEDFMEQEDLGIEIAGICDIFDNRAEWHQKSCANLERVTDESKLKNIPKRYNTYKELIANPEIDAVIIATPDHWHGTIAIEAAKAGKHVYVEKPMTWGVEETFELRNAVKENNVVLQLGHQGRQTESYLKAKEAYEKGVLGKVTLVEVCTNRNDPNGAWVYDIDPDSSPETIDWKQFIGPAPWHDFSLERFHRWRCWWDYGTGLNGDLLTHEYDAVNQVMNVGIPTSATCSGGIYFFKDGREVPDVQNCSLEFNDHDMSMLYSASLASTKHRGKVFMGHDANMEMSNSLVIHADRDSTKYKENIQSGLIDPEVPIYSYIPGLNNTDGIATATEQYFAKRGLLYTYRGNKRVDTTHLHLREWLHAIKTNTQPSCDIDQGFEEAITAHMCTRSYREGRRIYWDKDKEEMFVEEKI